MSDSEDVKELKNLSMVKDYLSEIGLGITREGTEEHLVIVDDESRGLKNLVIDCEDSILILEQVIVVLKNANDRVFKRRLQSRCYLQKSVEKRHRSFYYNIRMKHHN